MRATSRMLLISPSRWRPASLICGANSATRARVGLAASCSSASEKPITRSAGCAARGSSWRGSATWPGSPPRRLLGTAELVLGGSRLGHVGEGADPAAIRRRVGSEVQHPARPADRLTDHRHRPVDSAQRAEARRSRLALAEMATHGHGRRSVRPGFVQASAALAATPAARPQSRCWRPGGASGPHSTTP